MKNSQGIEGLPPGTRLVGLKKATVGDPVWSDIGRMTRVRTIDIDSSNRLILAPDNAYGRFLDEELADVRAAGREPLDGGPEVWFDFANDQDCWMNGKAVVGSSLVRVILLKPLPKVKRYLVERREIFPDENSRIYTIYNREVNTSMAESLAAKHPEIYSIVEEPCK